MEEWIQQLKNNTSNEVHSDAFSRKIYSVDASIFEVEPLVVVLPKTKDDIVAVLKIAQEYRIPVIPRGAATGITGGCLGKGLILDLSKYCNKLIEVDYERGYAICEPGLVQDRLNEALSDQGFRLGPDTSTGNRATIGGMLANNAAGARSLHYGCMVDHVEEVELALMGGTVLHFGALNETEWQNKISQNDSEGTIYRAIRNIQSKYSEDIKQHFPNIPRRVSGYNLNELLKPTLNISKIITGSEGSLGVVTKIKVKIAKKPKHTGLAIVHLHTMLDGLEAIEEMLSFKPLSLEMIDDKIIEMGRLSPSMKYKLSWLIGKPQVVIVAEFEGNTTEEVDDQLKKFAKFTEKQNIGYQTTCLRDLELMNNVWEVRKAGLGLLLSKRTYNRAVAFIEDISIGPDKLASFMKKFTIYLKEMGKEAGIYGHAGSGCIHIRPYLDLRSEAERNMMKKIMEDIAALLLEYNGAMSGEHGDGIIRSWLNQTMFGKRIYQAFNELKSAFDPLDLMNPGKIINGPDPRENLRGSPKTKISTFLDFTPEGGLELAADLCNGNGLCRKAEKVMCPSFQATNDEYHTTRARAQSLRSVFNGQLPISDFTSRAMYDVLDLCLECKGCKTECPSQVDMAKMKAEFLYHYHKKNGQPLRDYLFGHIGTINRITSSASFLFNSFSNSFLSKKVLGWLGIASQRMLPQQAAQSFSQWLKTSKKTNAGKKVVLFNDTFTEFNHPNVGISAYKILQTLGFEVIVPAWQCCGRPLLSKGMLIQARSKALKLVKTLLAYADQGLPIIGLEPSCILTIKDDFASILGSHSEISLEKIQSISAACFTFDEFLEKFLVQGQLPLSFSSIPSTVAVHGHCHQKALIGMKPTLNVLKGIANFKVSEIPSGCCGMAGSFGYEKEHYEISMKIGELHLFPTVRACSDDTIIIANGTSCRSQIEQGTTRKAFHIAEVIANNLKK